MLTAKLKTWHVINKGDKSHPGLYIYIVKERGVWGEQLGYGFTAEYDGKGCLVLGEAWGSEIYAVVEVNQKKNKRLGLFGERKKGGGGWTGRSNSVVELNSKKNEWRGCLQGSCFLCSYIIFFFFF